MMLISVIIISSYARLDPLVTLRLSYMRFLAYFTNFNEWDITISTVGVVFI